jgi:hypothetical protein
MDIAHNPKLIEILLAKGVKIHAPQAVVVSGVDPARIEEGVELFPGVVLCGERTLLRSGVKLGRAGGGYFENVAAGRDVDLYGGFFQDCVFLDGVTMRGHAEVRGGTLLEECCEGAHHVGYKMTVALPFVVAGSLVNFCDVLLAGGRSRRDHTEIGSAVALYNFTPWGDKFASMFGDVVRGVFLNNDRIFIGGQTQVVSPVEVGYGAVLAAGCAVRRDVPPGVLYGEDGGGFSGREGIDVRRYGEVAGKLRRSAHFIAQMRALQVWYQRVRGPLAGEDVCLRALYEEARRQIQANVDERLLRMDALVGRLPGSLALHQEALGRLGDGDQGARAKLEARIGEHARVIGGWAQVKAHLAAGLGGGQEGGAEDALGRLVCVGEEAKAKKGDSWRYIQWIGGGLDGGLVQEAQAQLQACVDGVMDGISLWVG